ncbi:DUF3592 domain-containing protein [Haloactinomyces albus]|uniref:DUF3592 domain-containing protein n=1 Tax=Haloactinomyces albus TaxID=1352928 RepID=A0AAE3ZEI7_9ACTN|nr:DUF3592 domain-containing protein [Haloactinomyces albus]MDR7302386.1 hypothetical protein [Haloactinomyces albus]
MVSDAVSREATGAATGVNTHSSDSLTWWPRSRVQRLAARLVLMLGGLCTALLMAILLACFIDDRIIESSRGTAVAEVLETSWTRTVVRFDTDDGRVVIPAGGVFYPSGLHEGQLVRVEYNEENPDLVRVADRTMTVALLPVFSALAVVWAVLLPVYWLLRRAASRALGQPT